MDNKLKDRIEVGLLNFIKAPVSLYLISKRLHHVFFDVEKDLDFKTIAILEREFIFERFYNFVQNDPNYQDYISKYKTLVKSFPELIPLVDDLTNHLREKCEEFHSDDEHILFEFSQLNILSPITKETLQLFEEVAKGFEKSVEISEENLKRVFDFVEHNLYVKKTNDFFRFLGIEVNDTHIPIKESLETKNSTLKAFELSLIYYIFFRSRGLAHKEIKNWYGKIIYKVKRKYSSDNDMSQISSYETNIVDPDKAEKSEFNKFTHALFAKIIVSGDTGEDQIRRYIQVSDSKSTVFNCKKKGKVDHDKLKKFWRNFKNLNIEYDILLMQTEFNKFITEPITYLSDF